MELFEVDPQTWLAEADLTAEYFEVRRSGARRAQRGVGVAHAAAWRLPVGVPSTRGALPGCPGGPSRHHWQVFCGCLLRLRNNPQGAGPHRLGDLLGGQSCSSRGHAGIGRRRPLRRRARAPPRSVRPTPRMVPARGWRSRHTSARTEQPTQTAFALRSLLIRASPRSFCGWKNRSGSASRQDPTSCHSHVASAGTCESGCCGIPSPVIAGATRPSGP